MSEKDKELKALEGAPLARVPLTDTELDSLEREIRRALAGSCSIKNLADNATAALVHPDTLGVAFKAFGYAPALIEEIRAGRAWRKEAEALLREMRALFTVRGEGDRSIMYAWVTSTDEFGDRVEEDSDRLLAKLRAVDAFLGKREGNAPR